MITDYNLIAKKIKSSMETMDIPESRKILYLSNIQWLQRNLGIRNNNHKDFHETMDLITKLLEIENRRIRTGYKG